MCSTPAKHSLQKNSHVMSTSASYSHTQEVWTGLKCSAFMHLPINAHAIHKWQTGFAITKTPHVNRCRASYCKCRPDTSRRQHRQIAFIAPVYSLGAPRNAPIKINNFSIEVPLTNDEKNALVPLPFQKWASDLQTSLHAGWCFTEATHAIVQYPNFHLPQTGALDQGKTALPVQDWSIWLEHAFSVYHYHF